MVEFLRRLRMGRTVCWFRSEISFAWQTPELRWLSIRRAGWRWGNPPHGRWRQSLGKPARLRPWNRLISRRCRLPISFRSWIHTKNGFARFHHVELIARQQFGVSRIVFKQGKLFTLLVVLRALLLNLLFQGLKSALLPLLFFDQRQEPAD